jgi:hypothetical protein
MSKELEYTIFYAAKYNVKVKINDSFVILEKGDLYEKNYYGGLNKKQLNNFIRERIYHFLNFSRSF